MKVFVTGATGYIGFNVASALRRAGHDVWGLVRNEAKARSLTQQEIYPVIGNMQSPESYRAVAESCSVLIHVAADYQSDLPALDRKTIEVLLDTGRKGPQPKTVIYTSGVWVYGNTGTHMADETASPAPATMVKWRPDHEQMVLRATHVKGLVIRPGCVYGKQGGLTATWFAAAHKDKSLRAIGDGSNHWAMVHVDDLAAAYVRAAECGMAGEVFNITDRSRSTVGAMVQAVARATGYTDKIQFIPVTEAAKTMGGFAECLALDQHVDARKAVRLLDWQPAHGGFVDGAEIYFASWKAYLDA